MIMPQNQAPLAIPRIRPARLGESPLQADEQALRPTDSCGGNAVGSTLSLVAEHEEQPVAGVSLTLTEGRTAHVHNLWITPAWTGSDLAVRMMVAVLEQGRKLGCLKVDMDDGVRRLAIVAMLLDCGLLMDQAGSEPAKQAEAAGSCYLNLYRSVESIMP